jgi:hypothetical protein
MEKLLTCLPRLTLAQLRTLWSTRGCVPQRPCKVPIAPRGDSRLFCSFLQGGGVIVSGGRVAISSCTISGNTASQVRVQSSHRPNGKLTFRSLLAGRWCHSLWRHSDHLIVHHQWEHSWPCARSSPKVPNAPMGKLLTCLSRLTLAQLRTPRSTTVGARSRDLVQNAPIAPMGDSRSIVVYRAVVSSSGVAQ